jgi:hypothetical protein
MSRINETSDIKKLRRDFGIRDHWGIPDSVVLQMENSDFFDPQEPVKAASDHILRRLLPAEFYRTRAREYTRMVEQKKEICNYMTFGQIIEYHLIADWLSDCQDFQ